MKNVEFDDDKIKSYYKTLLKNNPGLYSFMSKYRNTLVKVLNIVSNTYDINITINDGVELINITIDLLKNKINVSYPDKEYIELYNNILQKNITPIGYKYDNKERSVIKKNFSSLDNKKSIYYYELIDNDCSYNVLIEEEENGFNEKYFINKLLYSSNKYLTLSNLFLTVLNDIYLEHIVVKITDARGGIAIIDKGSITKYTEYREKDKEYQKIYFDNGEFYVEKKTKELYQGELNSYVKKIGENNGKEKR